ncbi:MAG: hypothetical protein JRF43_06300, partial [Deltaproteobacteria bacterium]|nr:hypothetical protein [Deltaproteobacteria bacterium]
SRLSEISGVGPKREQVLLKHFGSLTRVRQASSEEISKVPGISKELARTIYEHLSSYQGIDPVPSHFSLATWPFVKL